MKRFVKTILGLAAGTVVGIVVAVKIKDKIDYSKCRTDEDYRRWENRHTQRKEKAAEKFKDAAKWCAQNEDAVKGMTLAVEFGSAVLLGISRAKKVTEASKVSKKVNDIADFIYANHDSSIRKGEQRIITKVQKAATNGHILNLYDFAHKKMLHFKVVQAV